MYFGHIGVSKLRLEISNNKFSLYNKKQKQQLDFQTIKLELRVHK